MSCRSNQPVRVIFAQFRCCRSSLAVGFQWRGLTGMTRAARPLGRRFTHSDRPETIQVRWILKDGTESVQPAAIGDTLLQAAHRHEIPVEGACEGVCACSTCHCILERSVYESLPEASEAEEDMLDQAFGQTPTSRLGCQVTLTADLHGIAVRLPKATRNFYVVSAPPQCPPAVLC